MNISSESLNEPLADVRLDPRIWGQQPRRQSRTGWRFMLSHPAHIFAQGFGSGLAWIMPGTFGTLFGWLTFICLDGQLNNLSWLALLVLSFGFGTLVCHITGKHLGVMDHGSIVWDEIVAIWLVLWVLPRDSHSQMWAVVLFRFFDMAKPPPICYFDRRMKHGFGVMFDDIVAAFCTLFVFAVWAKF
jgi:phosphatidylglycerophosphatase A